MSSPATVEFRRILFTGADERQRYMTDPYFHNAVDLAGQVLDIAADYIEDDRVRFAATALAEHFLPDPKQRLEGGR